MLVGPPPWVQLLPVLHGVHPIITYTSTSENSWAKDAVPDIPLLYPLPFLAKPNNSVHGSVKWLFHVPLEGQQPLLVWILLAPGLIGDMEHQKTALMAVVMVAHECGHQSHLTALLPGLHRNIEPCCWPTTH